MIDEVGGIEGYVDFLERVFVDPKKIKTEDTEEGDTEIEDKNSDAQQIYLEEREKSDVYSDAEYVTVDFYHWGVVVDFYDEEKGWLK